MADDAIVPRLHPDDLEIIMRALSRGMASGSPVDAPPTIATGADVAVFRRVMREEIERNKKDIIGPDAITIRDIVREEIHKLYDEHDEATRRVVREEVQALRTEVFTIFEDLDMPLEREGGKRKQTAEKLSGLFAMHEGSRQFKSELWKAIRAWSITGIVGTLGAGITYLLTRGGSSH